MTVMAEASALGAALASDKAADLVADLLPVDAIQRDAHRTLLQAIVELRAAGRPADLPTVADHLGQTGRLDEVGGPTRLYELMAGAPSGQVEEWCRIVRAGHRRRTVVDVLARARTELEAGADLDVTVEQTVAGLTGTGGQAAVDPDVMLERFYERLDAGTPLAGWRMPWPQLQFFRLPDDGLTVWTGLPGSGKSTLLDVLVVEWLQAHPDLQVAFFSPEMAPPDNHLLELTRTSLGHEPRRDRHRAAEVAEQLAQRCHWIDDDRDVTPSAVLAAARRLVRDRQVRLLVIDPYNNLEPDRAERHDRQDLYIQALLRKLRRFARTTGCAVVVVAHPRRTEKVPGTDAVFRIPTAGDISGGQEWWNHADAVVSVWRNQSGEEPERFGAPSDVRVVVSKCRFAKWGQPGKGRLTFAGQDVRSYR